MAPFSTEPKSSAGTDLLAKASFRPGRNCRPSPFSSTIRSGSLASNSSIATIALAVFAAAFLFVAGGVKLTLDATKGGVSCQYLKP